MRYRIAGETRLVKRCRQEPLQLIGLTEDHFFHFGAPSMCVVRISGLAELTRRQRHSRRLGGPLRCGEVLAKLLELFT